MKKLFGWMMILVMSVVVSSCTDSADNYLETVPNESIVAVKVNFGQLLSKSQVLEDSQVRGALRSALREVPRNSRDLIEEMLANPNACGLDLDKPIVFALENIEQQMGMVAMAVNDQAKLKNYIQTILDDANVRDISLSDNHGVNTIEDRRGNSLAAFDDSRFVISIASGNSDAMEYMKLSENRQAVRDVRFKTFFASESDVQLLYDYEQLVRLASRAGVNSVDMPSLRRYTEGAIGLLSLDFQQGQFCLASSVEGNDEMMRYASNFYQEASASNLKYVPGDALAVLNVGVHNLSQCFDNFDSSQRRELDDAFEQLGLRLRDLDMIDGDITGSLLPMEFLGNDKLPQAELFVPCKDRKLFDAVVRVLGEDSRVARDVYALHANTTYSWDEDYNYVEGTNGYDYYLGFADDVIFLLPENIYNDCVSGGRLQALSRNFTRSNLSLPANDEGVVADVQRLVAELRTNYDSRSTREVIDVLSIFKTVSMSVKSPDRNGMELKVEMTDGSSNALKQITDCAIDQVARNMMR